MGRYYSSTVKSANSDWKLDFNRIRLKPIERVEVRLRLSSGSTATFYVQIESLRYGDKGVPIDQLPEPTRSRLQNAIKKYGGQS